MTMYLGWIWLDNGDMRSGEQGLGERGKVANQSEGVYLNNILKGRSAHATFLHSYL